MEVLSGVASGMAVVSLTVQLLQSTNTIKTFIRDVKSASKELERLSELLNCLNALLTNVRDVMERQTSLQHCPLPPQTIFDCLRSCECSLGLLEDIAKKYEKKQGGNASTMRKLKDDIKFGFKTQDISGIEARIQRDINGLNTALGTNATNIQYVVTRPVHDSTKSERQTYYTIRSASL
jgi:DNA repair ATPase RecN